MARLPKERTRPYDTTEPSPLGDVLSNLFALRGYGRVQADRQLHDAWKEAAGPSLTGQTRVLALKNGVLQIGVSNSALMSELASFQKPELLQRLQQSAPALRIRDLKFRLRGDLGSG